jgi:hypothetical protein
MQEKQAKTKLTGKSVTNLCAPFQIFEGPEENQFNQLSHGKLSACGISHQGVTADVIVGISLGLPALGE